MAESGTTAPGSTSMLPAMDEIWYRALQARDPRFDGLFFVGVRTTRIYCRAICPARTPHFSSCRFFTTPAGAEQAGFRPCLRCRPELAPAAIDFPLAQAILGSLQRYALEGESIGRMADRIGISFRHMRRIMVDAVGTNPRQIVQTHRLLSAKRLLQDTNLPLIEVAQQSGFGSLTRFHATFRKAYRTTPHKIRRKTSSDSELTLKLGYRPPFAWPDLLDYLRARVYPGVEAVQQSTYVRSIRLAGEDGWIAISNDSRRNHLKLSVAPSLNRHLFALVEKVKNFFDLEANPARIEGVLCQDHRLAKTIHLHPGLRVIGAFDFFQLAFRAVLGQQVSVAAATTLSGRAVRLFGRSIATPFSEVTHLGMEAETIAAATVEEIAQIGLPRARAKTLQQLAQKIALNEFRFGPLTSIEEVVRQLCVVPGIGPWTAHYIAMRALRFPDAFPAGDLGIRRALSPDLRMRQEEVLAHAEKWRPWRSYAAMVIWRGLQHEEDSCGLAA